MCVAGSLLVGEFTKYGWQGLYQWGRSLGVHGGGPYWWRRS